MGNKNTHVGTAASAVQPSKARRSGHECVLRTKKSTISQAAQARGCRQYRGRAALQRRVTRQDLIRGFSPCRPEKSSRPTVPCDGPRMNRQVDVGNPPRPFRHLRMAERCTPDPSSSRVPVHSALVQKSVTAITNPAGRLSPVMLGELPVN